MNETEKVLTLTSPSGGEDRQATSQKRGHTKCAVGDIEVED
jgi:hypothetical protein